MPLWLARIVACFVFPRERRRAFRARHCVKRETRIERIERKIDLLTRAFLMKETAPDAFRALSAPAALPSGIFEKLSAQLWANAGGNGEIKRLCVTTQAELLRELFYLLPTDAVAAGLKRLLVFSYGDASRVALLDALSWVRRRDENYAAAFDALKPDFDAGTEFPAALLRRFALCALRAGNEAEAARALRAHHARFGTRDLWRGFDTARLSEKLGGSDAEIRAVVSVGTRLEKSLCEGVFEETLSGKRVAVVGNGPQEVGRGNGAKIDAYDVVIRFNDFPTDEKFRRDYGGKTDVWVTSCHTKTAWREGVPVVLAGDFFYADEFPDTWLVENLARRPETRATAIPLDFYGETRRESGIKLPTLGALVLARIKKLRPDFSADDVFGFSFKETIPPKKLEHYYGSAATRCGTIHDLDEERVYLRRLFGMEGA